MFVIEFNGKSLTAFGMLVDAPKGPSFTFIADQARLTVDGSQIKGQYDRDNGVITFTDDGTGTVYEALAKALPKETPHYIDGIPGTFQYE